MTSRRVMVELDIMVEEDEIEVSYNACDTGIRQSIGFCRVCHQGMGPVD